MQERQRTIRLLIQGVMDLWRYQPSSSAGLSKELGIRDPILELHVLLEQNNRRRKYQVEFQFFLRLLCFRISEAQSFLGLVEIDFDIFRNNSFAQCDDRMARLMESGTNVVAVSHKSLLVNANVRCARTLRATLSICAITSRGSPSRSNAMTLMRLFAIVIL